MLTESLILRPDVLEPLLTGLLPVPGLIDRMPWVLDLSEFRQEYIDFMCAHNELFDVTVNRGASLANIFGNDQLSRAIEISEALSD